MNLKFIVFCFSLSLAFPAHSGAQNYKWDWAAMGLGGTAGGLVATDHLGNVFLAGTPISNLPDSFGTFILNTSNLTGFIGNWEGIVVSKYDASGNILWANGIKNDSTNLLDINTDQHNNLYLFGYYTGQSVTVGPYTLYRQDTGSEFFFVKYSQNGVIINAFNVFSISTMKVWGGTYGFWGLYWNFCVQNDKIYLSLPYKGRDLSFGPFTLHNVDTSRLSNLLIAKLDTSGNVLWAKKIDSKYGIYPTGLSVANSENIYLSGDFSDTSLLIGNTTLINKGSVYGTNYFLAKFDSSGHSVWAKSIDYSGPNETNHQVTTDIDENVYAVGTFDQVMTCDNQTLSGSSSSIFLAKFDPGGTLLWLKKVTDTGAAHSVVTDACGNVWLSGGSTDYNTIDGHHISPGSPGQFTDGYSMFLAAWTTEGRYITSSILQSGNGTVGILSNIAADETGNVYLGSTYGLWDNGYSFPYQVGRSTLFDAYFDSISFALVQDFSVADIFVAKFKVDTPTSATTVCLDKNTSLKAPDGYITYSWKDGTTAVSHPADSFGVNWVTSIGTCKYNVSIDTFILEQCHCPAFVPNAFTPNDDGKNDEVHPLFQSDCAINDYNFAIFNRFGEAVFKSRNPSEKWNGKLHGVPAETSTYFYYLEYKGGYDKKSYSQKGDITLVR